MSFYSTSGTGLESMKELYWEAINHICYDSISIDDFFLTEDRGRVVVRFRGGLHFDGNKRDLISKALDQYIVTTDVIVDGKERYNQLFLADSYLGYTRSRLEVEHSKVSYGVL